jgi:CRP/FNR family transcriptional regulator, dissimilatory nitrate respiration regulator
MIWIMQEHSKSVEGSAPGRMFHEKESVLNMPGAQMDWQAMTRFQPALTQIPNPLRNLAKLHHANTGETLFRIGDPVANVFFVISGEVRLVRRDREGGEIVLQRSRGGFIAEASLNSTAYHCDMVVGEKAAILNFPVQPFRAVLGENVDFRDAWMAQLANEVRKLRAQCERLSLHGAAERIVHYLQSEGVDGRLTLNRSRKAWAAELGLSHEALYRTLGRLRAAGMLEVDGARIALIHTNHSNQAKKMKSG